MDSLLMARHARCAGPHRLVVPGQTEHVHIVEAMPTTSRRSTFHPRSRGLFAPKYNRQSDLLNGLNRRLLGSPLTRIQHRRHHVFAHLFGDFRIACGIPIRAIKLRPSRAPGCKICRKNWRLFLQKFALCPRRNRLLAMTVYWADYHVGRYRINFP